MSKYAWVKGGVIRDLTGKKPEEVYVNTVAALYDQLVPQTAKVGDLWDGITLTPKVQEVPVIPVTVVAPPPKLSITEFWFLLTVAERLAVRASIDASLLDFLKLLDDPRCVEVDLSKDYVKDFVEYLFTLGLLIKGRKTKVLAGRFPNDPAL